MSAIDTIWHEVIGQINGIPIYRLKEDAEEKAHHGFDGKKGDVLLGGGSGEAAAMRISIPEAIQWFTGKDTEILFKYNLEELVKTHWSNNNAYEFIKEYITLGYDPKECPIETWLAEHIVSFLIKKFPNQYEKYVGALKDEDGEPTLTYGGSICAAPEKEWVDFCNEWFKNRNK